MFAIARHHLVVDADRRTSGPPTDWRARCSRRRLGRTVIAEYAGTSIPTDAKPTDVVVAPDGNQWYTFPGRDSIARVTPSGEVQEVTAGISSGAAPRNTRGTGTTRSIRLKAKAPRRRR
jgi:hypothetical protein